MTARLERWLSAALIAALVLWGAFALFSYLAAEPHAAMLASRGTVDRLAALCPAGGWLCRGLWVVPSGLIVLAARLDPVVWFVFWSAVSYAALLIAQAWQGRGWRIRGTLRPWHVLALFLGVTWLLFSVFSRTLGLEGHPIRMIHGPVDTAPPTAAAAERGHLRTLLEPGCLERIGDTRPVGPVYALREWCVQAAFLTRVLPPLVFLALLALECLLLGSALLRWLRLDPLAAAPATGPGVHAMPRAVIALGVGVGGWIALLWACAQLSVYTAAVGWALLAVVPLACAREWRPCWRWLREAGQAVDLPWWSGRALGAWGLLALLALNYLSIIRPDPVGWDDIGSYLNYPRLLVGYGAAIPMMGTFQWEYLTSLGYLLFGLDNPDGTTIALAVNWLAGALAAAAVLAVGGLLLGPGAGILPALLYYATPLIQHISYADMKTDNAVFFVGSLALLSALLWLDPPPGVVARHRYGLLAGVFSGLVFGMKPTAIMVGVAAGILLLRGALGPWGPAGGGALGAVAFAIQGQLDVAKLWARIGAAGAAPSRWVLAALGALGAVALVAGAARRRHGLGLARAILPRFAIGALVLALPWMAVNSWRAGAAVPTLRLAPPNTLSARFQLSDARPLLDAGGPIRKLPRELQIDLDHPACAGSGKSEELDRYWGTGHGVGHYLTLPWRAVMNRDAAGYYVMVLPAFLLLPVALLLPALWTPRGRGARALLLATAVLLVEWMLLANGVPWYGIGALLGLVVAAEALCAWAPSRVARALATALVAASLLIAVSLRLGQLDLQRGFFEYPMGKASAEVMRARASAHFDQIRATVLLRARQHPDSPYLYRVGTFIPYFIPRNIELLPFADSQLDFFNCLNQERDHRVTMRRLQALGFNSVIFDTHTATIEKDPDGTLHRKARALVEFLNDPAVDAQVVVNDPAEGVAFVLLPVLP